MAPYDALEPSVTCDSLARCPRGVSIWTAFVVGVQLAACFTAVPLSAQTEADIKVAALNRLLSFVRWPPGGHQKGELVIGVLGENPLGLAIDMLEGRTVFGRRIRVRRFDALADVGRPHILYLGAEASRRLSETLAVAGKRGILTVGETDDFTTDGGAVSFRFADGTLRITLNLCAFRDAGLEASSRLRRLATVSQSACPIERRP